ncbi:MAG: LON peptidase substrate-binding domain-containing protein [Litoreibacter sp.]|uniref:LON peptidase substrate-binding domain-containing protein n=1 Tax=Litoreibacter sp. TaxID=1969459 RepID=UPI003298E7E1
MISHGDLPEMIPVFPLPGALLLPRARLPLQLFEPRYLQMFEDVLKTSQRLIGMIQPHMDANGDEQLHAIGCVGRITQFSETDDGRYMVTLAGISRFRILEEVEGFQPYRRVKASWAGFERDVGAAESDPSFDRPAFMVELKKFFDAHDLKTDWDGMKEAEAEMLINSLSMLCPFEPEEKQALLEAPSLITRRETLMTLIEFSLRGGSAEEIVQ